MPGIKRWKPNYKRTGKRPSGRPFKATLRTRRARANTRRESSIGSVAKVDSTMLNYANLPPAARFKVNGFYNSTITATNPRWFFFANSIEQPIQFYSGGSYGDTGFDCIGYDTMKSLYGRYLVYACKVELEFMNVTPYDNGTAAATTPKVPLVLKIQAINSQDTAVDPIDLSYQFGVQPNCIEIPIQTNAVGPSKTVKVTRWLTGKELASGFWDESDLNWSGQFNNTKPTNSYGLRFYGTDWDSAYITGDQTIQFYARYTMYGKAFGKVPLDDV